MSSLAGFPWHHTAGQAGSLCFSLLLLSLSLPVCPSLAMIYLPASSWSSFCVLGRWMDGGKDTATSCSEFCPLTLLSVMDLQLQISPLHWKSSTFFVSYDTALAGWQKCNKKGTTLLRHNLMETMWDPNRDCGGQSLERGNMTSLCISTSAD